MKVCIKCKLSKEIVSFNKKRNTCKECQAIIKREWYNKNRQYALDYRRNYHRDNFNKEVNYKKEYNAKNILAIREYNKAKYTNNKDAEIKRVADYTTERLKVDLVYRLKFNIRRRLSSAIKRKGQNKIYSTIRGIGCTAVELKKYLEERFDDKMSWENYGSYWHIDHIIPLASFNLMNKEQFEKACHYTNLQPLEAKENLRKHCKII